MTLSEIVTSILNNNVAVGVLIAVSLCVVIHLKVYFVARRPRFSKKECRRRG